MEPRMNFYPTSRAARPDACGAQPARPVTSTSTCMAFAQDGSTATLQRDPRAAGAVDLDRRR